MSRLHMCYILQMLLGTFTCTAVPGEFVWTPGLLTKVSVSCVYHHASVPEVFYLCACATLLAMNILIIIRGCGARHFPCM